MPELKGLTRSVIIGLGGTGQEVVMRLRKLLVAEYADLKKVPVVRFLVIDTDKNLSPPPTAATGDYGLEEGEFIQATIPDPAPIYKGIKDTRAGGQQHIGEWFDVKKLGNIANITEGAKSIRQIGRLCFFHNYSKISAELSRIRSQMDPNDLEDAMLRDHGIQVDNGYNVYIVGSLAGGTGSGMLLDMAYMARKVFQLPGQVSRSIGVLLMPQAFADTAMSDRKLANGYAALRELNYYMYQGLPDDPAGILFRDKRFKAVYNKVSVENAVNDTRAPFQYCYLIDTTNQGKVNLTRPQLFEMIARNLSLEFTSQFAQYKRSMRDNIEAQMTGGTDALGSPLNFFSFGLSSIYLPSREIEQALVFKLAAAAAARWIALSQQITNKSEDDQNVTASMSEYVENFLGNNKLLEKPSQARRDLVLRVLTDEKGANLSQRAAAVKGSVERLWQEEKWNVREYPERLRRQVVAQEARLKQPGSDKKQWGEWAQRMDAMGKQLERDLETAVHAEVADMIENSDQGPSYARRFLDALDEKLKTVAGELREEYSIPRRMAQVLGNLTIINDLGGKVLTGLEPSLQEKENTLWQKVEAASKALLRAEARVRETGSEYLTYATLRVRARCERLARETVNKALDEFRRGALHEERERLDRIGVFLRQLVGELTRFQGEYEKHTKVLLINGELLYGEEIEQTVERFYKEYMPNEMELINLIQRQVLEDPKVAGDARSVRLLDLPDLADRNPGLSRAIREAIVARCEVYATGVSLDGQKLVEISAAVEMIRGKNQADQEEKVRSLRPRLNAIYNKSNAFINLESVVPEWNPAQLGTANLVGMYGANVAGADADEQNGGNTVVDIISGIVGRDNVKEVTDPHQILFTREVGAFPLRAVAGMETLRGAYESVSSQSGQAPLHFVQNAENFPDIFPRKEALEEALRAWMIGTKLNVIRQQDKDWVVPYQEAGQPSTLLLGGNEQAALMTLLNDGARDGEEPWRRRMIIAEANKIDKQKVLELLIAYRQTLPQRDDRGDTPPAYEYIAGIIQSYKRDGSFSV